MFVLLSCNTTNNTSSTAKNFSNNAALEAYKINPAMNGRTLIEVDNPTWFDVYFEGDQKVEHGAKGGKIYLTLEDQGLTSGFNILYEIPLSDKMSLFCFGDNKKIINNQNYIRIAPPVFTMDKITRNYGIWIKIINKSNNTIALQNGGTYYGIWEQRGDHLRGNAPIMSGRQELGPKNTGLYNIEQDIDFENYTVKDSRNNIPLKLPGNIKKNHLYTFEYDDKNIMLIDQRPLQNIGETTWSRTVDNAVNLPLSVYASDLENIIFVMPAETGMIVCCLDKNGEIVFENKLKTDRETVVTSLLSIDGRLIFSGYRQRNNSEYASFFQELSAGSFAGYDAPLSERNDCRYSYFNSVIHDGADTFLAVGAASYSGLDGDFLPYLRAFKGNGSSFYTVWEIGPDDYVNLRLGPVKSAYYDKLQNIWRICGRLLPDIQGAIGAYVCSIDAKTGVLLESVTMPDCSFNKILTDGAGDYYLIGEQKTSAYQSYAVVMKYDAKGKAIWKSANQIPSHSYYMDAIISEDDACLVLAGTMAGKNEFGLDGKPFMQWLKLEDGTQEYFKNMSAIDGSASLVSNVIKMPDYGYIIVLSGVSGNFIAPPYIIARTGERGHLINHKTF
jgi:hypothetical protein